MIHIGKNTKSTIISKGISAGRGQNTYRGLVKIEKSADGARNHTQCDSLLIGKKCGAHTFPYIEVKNPGAIVEHEATTSKISDDQLFYCRSRGIAEEDAVSMIVDGFCKQVFRELPMEFAVEAKKLLEVSLEGAVGWRRSSPAADLAGLCRVATVVLGALGHDQRRRCTRNSASPSCWMLGRGKASWQRRARSAR